MSDDVRLQKLGTVMLRVRDLAASLAFYRDVLGLAAPAASGAVAFVDAGGVQLALNEVKSAVPPSDDLRTELVFEVSDVAAAYRSLKARGVAFRTEPRAVAGARYAADFRDPDGHVLSIYGPNPGG
jgi:lactoylglutathione lyase